MFAASGRTALDLYEKPTSGAGNQTRLSGITSVRRALSWAPNGRHVLYQDGQFRMIALPLTGERQPVSLLERESTAVAQFWARFAPNGRWIAYTSSESGRNEVYVMPFPGPGGKSLVSTAGGTWARWRRDGKEMFYVESNGRLMAAEIEVRESAVRVGPVRPLFQIRGMRQNFSYMYDVSPDGQRFLINTILQDAEMLPLTFVANWPTLLQQ
jgi:Tol biopolymer transport system component